MRPSSAKELLKDLVRIPSVNQFITGSRGAEERVARYLKKAAKAWGMKAHLMKVPGVGHNLLIKKHFRRGAPWILFASHMDTVSAEGMDFDPFCGCEKNGRILGRGACDDKGSIAASLWALKELSASGRSRNNIAVLCTVDEEQRRHGASAFSTTQLPRLHFKPAGVIVAEPTSLKPIIAHAGIGHFTVVTRGVAAHASNPAKGRSAIKDMMKVMHAIEKEYIAGLTATDLLCGKAQCSINMISGGRQVNAIPDECTIHVDRRLMPGEDAKGVIPAVEKVLTRLRKKEPSLRVSINPSFSDTPLSQDPGSPFIKAVLSCLKESGLDAKPKGAPFATDAGALSSAGLPCVVLGPGDDSLAHTANESIRVSELNEGVRVFKKLMADTALG